MSIARGFATALLLMTAGILVPVADARAELMLSQLVVELTPGDRGRSDIEIWNKAPDRAYVTTEPREILNPGTPNESRKQNPDPEQLGLLVSPSQLILEPGQRRLLRIAAIAPASDREHVYRVTVRPVVEGLSAPSSGLKVLIGYDVLVLVRPKNPAPHVSGARRGNQLILRNDGNISVELVDGKQCIGSACTDLPGGRLYAGAEKRISASPTGRVQYTLKAGDKVIPVQF